MSKWLITNIEGNQWKLQVWDHRLIEWRTVLQLFPLADIHAYIMLSEMENVDLEI